METLENKEFVYEFGRFVLNPRERLLSVDGKVIRLAAKEFETLLFLVQRNGRAISKEEMMSAIWQDAFVEESNVAKQISRLRKLLNKNGDQFIETIPKHGYRFKADLQRRVWEPDVPVVVEKRTVQSVTLEVENDTVPQVKALTAGRQRSLSVPLIAAVALMQDRDEVWTKQFLAGTRLDPVHNIVLSHLSKQSRPLESAEEEN